MKPIFRLTSKKYNVPEGEKDEKVLHATISLSFVSEDAYSVFKEYFKQIKNIDFWVSDKETDKTDNIHYVFGSITVVGEGTYKILLETIEEVFGVSEKDISTDIADDANKRIYTIYKSKGEGVWKLKYPDDTGCYQHIALTSNEQHIIVMEAEEIARSKKVPWKLYLSEARKINEG